MKIYYAHCMSIYDTPQEARDVKTLEKLGFEVVNPNHEGSEEAYQKEGMDYFKRMVGNCHALAFRALPSGEIPAGIASEIKRAEFWKIPVFELPTRMRSRMIDVECTREYLRESGQR